MDTARRPPKGKMPGKGTREAVMEPPSAGGKMPSEARPTAVSGEGKMPGEAAVTTEAVSGRGKMPGEATPTAASGREKMPGEAMPTAASGRGKMPGEAMPTAASGRGKMPGEAMPAAVSGEGKMPGEVVTETTIMEAPEAVEQYSVFHKPGVSPTAAALAGLGPYTLRGSTPNFDVSYDNSLGTNGQNLADAVLANCERDLFQLRGWFGGVAAGRFAVYIDPGSFGAYHASCAATELHLAAFAGTDGALENMLNVAEADEVMMANQGAGWNCGASAGEGLSRVLATQRYPASLDGFASASSWLNSNRPDWVTNTEGTDRNYVSIGCATLFLNYLRYQLHFSLVRIVEAGGTTLQQTYPRLTGSADAFGPFAALLQRHFPAGTPVTLPNDNPFPLLDAASWGGWESLGGTLASPPKVVAWGPN